MFLFTSAQVLRYFNSRGREFHSYIHVHLIYTELDGVRTLCTTEINPELDTLFNGRWIRYLVTDN